MGEGGVITICYSKILHSLHVILIIKFSKYTKETVYQSTSIIHEWNLIMHVTLTIHYNINDGNYFSGLQTINA